MDGADVWLSVRDRALRNPHIFQNVLKVVYDNLYHSKNFHGGPREKPQIPISKATTLREGKKGRFHPNEQFLDLSLTLNSSGLRVPPTGA